MLTRIEIDGFKSYEDFTMDVGPLAIVLGANGVGKSNLFDALRFLSRIATRPVSDAVRELRGRPAELFSFDAAGVPRQSMRFAVELLVPARLVDPFGNEVELQNTRLRYEVRLDRGRGSSGLEALFVRDESIERIKVHDDRWRPKGREPAQGFRDRYMRRSSRSAPYLSTEGQQFEIHQDGRAGRIRRLPATDATATALSTVSSAEEFPHVFAVRQELSSWLFLQLEPSAIRDPQRSSWNDRLDEDGRNLGRVLDRIRRETMAPDRPEGALAEIAADLRDIVDGVTGLSVDPDEASREFRIAIRLGERQVPYSSHLVSDGTLRALALCAVLNDPSFSGVLFMEEPEDGMHPARLLRLVQRMREHVTDPFDDAPGPSDALQQVITNSHSPVLLSDARDQAAEAWFADTVHRTSADGPAVRRTRMRAVVPMESQRSLFPPDGTVPTFEVQDYLSTVHGST